jgi:hypothetical protein
MPLEVYPFSNCQFLAIPFQSLSSRSEEIATFQPIVDLRAVPAIDPMLDPHSHLFARIERTRRYWSKSAARIFVWEIAPDR